MTTLTNVKDRVAAAVSAQGASYSVTMTVYAGADMLQFAHAWLEKAAS
jgi:hypothetical protein